ncbi:Pfs, NACHT and Ankyrin domain protein [Fusarium austroafricanum]|uniref:Pfs, NACHT and Ankyrin domain protein n=1 Tax=Fusarium austroafricanum TaxID=2364996 RepID=A0A8H4JXX2_9HYPO|nr:Pfs, NACHT and Ankyrin domain protein [Fusarium austroafricanum]
MCAERWLPEDGPENAFNSRDSGSHHVPVSLLSHEDYTIAWICALHLELAASQTMFDEIHRSLPVYDGDDNTYTLGRIDQHNIVMACLPGEYGTNNAAIVATNLKRTFPNIRATLMVGIGGGSPSSADIRLGDIVVGTRVMQYDLGKVIAGGEFEETADARIPAPLLLSAVSNLRSKHGHQATSARVADLLGDRRPSFPRPTQDDRLFQASYQHPPRAFTCVDCDMTRQLPRSVCPSNEPRVYYGVIASGNRVMRDAEVRDNVAWRLSALCFEMEAAGMMDNLRCLPIRGVCDYSDSHKNKDWQSYAAAAAAAYAKELLEVLPPVIKGIGYGREEWAVGKRAHFPKNNLEQNYQVSFAESHEGMPVQRRLGLLESLRFQQMDAPKTMIGEAHSKTCRWLLDHPAYRNWLNHEIRSDNSNFLWIRGKPGAGKSTIMKFLYLQARNQSTTFKAIASFFFNARGDYLEKSISGMYRSLLMQLLSSFPDLQLVLDDTDILPLNHKGCPRLNALKELLKKAILTLGRRSFICFIDALDECDEQEIRDMVQFFEELLDDDAGENFSNEGAVVNNIQFRVCFSSRPYPYIDVQKGALLTLEDEPGHKEDLAQYVESRLKIGTRSQLTFESVKAQILHKSAGIFIWVVLAVQILNKESCDGGLAIKKKLQEIPSKLDDLFRSILTRDQANTERLLLCILWILCAKRPLTPMEFCHALWAGLVEQGLVDPDLPDMDTHSTNKLVTSSSKGLVEIIKSSPPRVQFIHESVRDFLLKGRGLQTLWPDLGFEWEGPCHDRLRQCCMEYLNRTTMEVDIGMSRERRFVLPSISICPFFSYAIDQILGHADTASLVISQGAFLEYFFRSDWHWIFDKYKGLGNLIRTRMKKEAASYISGQEYDYPLFAALAKGHESAVSALLGCDGVNVTDGLDRYKDAWNPWRHRNRTPLSWAAQEDRPSLVKALIRSGVSTEEEDRSQYRPLTRALEQGHSSMAQLLIDLGADIHAQHSRHGWSALMWAARRGDESISRVLIDRGADINAKDIHGWTALIWASSAGEKAVAQLLVERGANVKATSNFGWPALLYASQAGHEEIALLLQQAERGCRN